MDVLAALGWPAVVQHRDDVFDGQYAQTMDTARITYGALARALPAICSFLAQSPNAMRAWSERIGMDLAEQSNLPRILLSVALRRNLAGPVLFSTTRPERVQVAIEAASGCEPLSDIELTSIRELADAARRSMDVTGTS
jgi:hypothetical protein